MRYVVSKAPGVPGPPIPDDEPCLVIRAQDILAEYMMREYISIASVIGVDAMVINDLYDHAETLAAWREVNRDKIKLADR